MGKVIVITGASKGIGRATALALAHPDVHLVLAARDETTLADIASEVHAAGGVATVFACDVGDETAVSHLMEHSADISGQIDALVNSAGHAIVRPFDELTPAEWDGMLRVGLTGTFFACQQAVEYMHAGGQIINVASIAARQGIPNWSAYCATKYGVLGFSNAIREELRPRGIRVTVVLPAATDTPLWDSIPGDWNRANMLQATDVGLAIARLIHEPAPITTEELVIGHVAGML